MSKSMSKAWPARPPAQTRGSIRPTGTPTACSACWHRRAISTAVSGPPKTSARATETAALEDSPDPTGRVDSMVSVPPVRTWHRAATATTRRAQAGSNDAGSVAGPGSSARGTVAGSAKAEEATSSVRLPVGVKVTVTPRPTARGRATPWL